MSVFGWMIRFLVKWENNRQHPLKCLWRKHRVRLFRRHDEHFTGMNEMLNAVNGKTSGAFQNRYHRIAGGIVGGDLLALCECEQGNADRLILRQCLADDLTVFGIYQTG